MSVSDTSLPEQVAITTFEQFAALRERQLRGEPISNDEYRAAIVFLRQSRITAAAAAPKGKSSKVNATEAAMKALTDLL